MICCVVCQEPPYQVVDASCCNSLFCKLCAEKVQGECPACKRPWVEGQYKENVPLQKVLNETTIKCVHCNEQFQLKQKLSHNQSCVMKTVQCPNSGNCSAVSRKDLIGHLKICEYRKIECPNGCGKSFSKNSLTNHVVEHCPFTIVGCKNDCGAQFKQQDFNQHERECPEVAQPCEFAAYGCDVKLKAEGMKDHMENSTSQHLLMLKNGQHFNPMPQVNIPVHDIMSFCGRIVSKCAGQCHASGPQKIAMLIGFMLVSAVIFRVSFVKLAIWGLVSSYIREKSKSWSPRTQQRVEKFAYFAMVAFVWSIIF
jgi:hypothetical protein